VVAGRMLLEYVDVPFNNVMYEQGEESEGFSRDAWLNVRPYARGARARWSGLLLGLRP
jgi:hypothetical protein